MLNEEKIKLMTKLSIYEEQTGKKALAMNKYFKNDYISIRMMTTALQVTFAYLLMVVLWVVYKIDYFMEELTNIYLIQLGQQILILYIVVLVIFVFISYVVYSLKLRSMLAGNQTYAEQLKELYLIYKREEKSKQESRIGGEESDDEDFSF
jgi:hypothetical protein